MVLILLPNGDGVIQDNKSSIHSTHCPGMVFCARGWFIANLLATTITRSQYYRNFGVYTGEKCAWSISTALIIVWTIVLQEEYYNHPLASIQKLHLFFPRRLQTVFYDNDFPTAYWARKRVFEVFPYFVQPFYLLTENTSLLMVETCQKILISNSHTVLDSQMGLF